MKSLQTDAEFKLGACEKQVNGWPPKQTCMSVPARPTSPCLPGSPTCLFGFKVCPTATELLTQTHPFLCVRKTLHACRNLYTCCFAPLLIRYWPLKSGHHR